MVIYEVSMIDLSGSAPPSIPSVKQSDCLNGLLPVCFRRLPAMALAQISTNSACSKSTGLEALED